MSVLPPVLFEHIVRLLKQQSGLSLSQEKEYLLESRLQPIARQHGLADVAALIQRMIERPGGELQYQVVEAMTTNESMFFRDTRPFDQLKQAVLPRLRAANSAKRHIRIWSAACSTGQEPYSIAMVLEEAPEMQGISYEIVATDLANKVIDRARQGIYSQFEIQRGLPIQMLMKYFEQQDTNQWAIKDSLKQKVEFRAMNLLEDFGGLGVFDIVFCRNVLIYFDEQTKADVLKRISRVMDVPGYLFLGSAETILGLTTEFKTLDAETRGVFTLNR